MKKILALLLIGAFVTTTLIDTSDAEAKGRKGSRRVGGTNSKGKGSHYRGGRK